MLLCWRSSICRSSENIFPWLSRTCAVSALSVGLNLRARSRLFLLRPDATDVLRAIRVPTLVLCGRQDSWAPVTQHEAMQRLVPGADLVVVEDAGHMAPMEQPQAVAAALLHWLQPK